jgi:hypothetical protein
MLLPAGPFRFRNQSAIARPRPTVNNRSSAERWCDRAPCGSRPKGSSWPRAPRRESCAVPRVPCQGPVNKRASRNHRQRDLARRFRIDRLGVVQSCVARFQNEPCRPCAKRPIRALRCGQSFPVLTEGTQTLLSLLLFVETSSATSVSASALRNSSAFSKRLLQMRSGRSALRRSHHSRVCLGRWRRKPMRLPAACRR